MVHGFPVQFNHEALAQSARCANHIVVSLGIVETSAIPGEKSKVQQTTLSEIAFSLL